MTIPEYLEKNSKYYRNKPAVKFGDRSITFEMLRERAYRVANMLLALGLKKGDRVAILAENCIEYPELYLGIGRAGCIVVPLNFRLTPSEITHLVAESGSCVLVFQETFLDMVKANRDMLKSVRYFICIGSGQHEFSMNYEELIWGSSSNVPPVSLAMEDVFCLFHTGGTTGTPKLAMLTHRNLLTTATIWIIEAGFYYGDVFLIFSPLSHTGAAWPLFFTFLLGNTLVIVRRFDVGEILRTVEREKVTAIMLMSQLVMPFITHPEFQSRKFDISSLKTIVVGAAILPEPQLRRLLNELPGVTVFNAGGQTECGIFTGIRLNEYIDSEPEKIASVGRCSLFMDIKIVDDNDNEVPAETVGELCVKGEGVMKGYWNKPDESSWSLRGGWQHTGDLCKLDKDGFLYYVDRKKDMIKTGGENVYSKEVEDIICLHPDVHEVAVIGVPDEKWGEAVKAIVVLKKGARIGEGEIISHCKKYLAGFKCPKFVEFVSELPRTSLGKIDKNTLRMKHSEPKT